MGLPWINGRGLRVIRPSSSYGSRGWQRGNGCSGHRWGPTAAGGGGGGGHGGGGTVVEPKAVMGAKSNGARVEQRSGFGDGVAVQKAQGVRVEWRGRDKL